MRNKLVIFLILTSSFLLSAYGGSATWNLSPSSGDWNTAANWTPATVPNGLTDVATFDLSNTTAVSLSASVQASLVFNSGASAYTTTIPSTEVLTINSPGITNNSGIVQEFVVAEVSGTGGGLIQFNSGTAGNLVHFDVLETDLGMNPSSRIEFHNSSNAGTASFDVEPATGRTTDAGHLVFYDSASASSATITLHGSAHKAGA